MRTRCDRRRSSPRCAGRLAARGGPGGRAGASVGRRPAPPNASRNEADRPRHRRTPTRHAAVRRHAPATPATNADHRRRHRPAPRRPPAAVRPGGRRRHRRPAARTATGRPRTLLDGRRRHGLHARRQRLRGRHRVGVRRLLRPELGPRSSPGRGRCPATTNTTRRTRPATSATSAPRPAIRTKGYYAYDGGAWRVYVLNSNCGEIGGCGAGSRPGALAPGRPRGQPERVLAGLLAPPALQLRCEHGSNAAMQALWQALYDAGAELVLAGHDHDYERFAPMDAAGNARRRHGDHVQFVVGTGGASSTNSGTILPNSRGTRLRRRRGPRADAGSRELVARASCPCPASDFTDHAQDVCH